MFEAENFHALSKRTLNASRHTRAIEHAAAIEDEALTAMVAEARPDPGRVTQLVELLATAMSTAPDGDAWTAAWSRYCRWQALAESGPTIDELVAFQKRISGDIRGVGLTATAVAISMIRETGPLVLRSPFLSALSAAAHDPQIWDALCQVRQGIMAAQEGGD